MLAIFLSMEGGLGLPCATRAAIFNGTHVAESRPALTIGNLRLAVANHVLTNLHNADGLPSDLVGLMSLSPTVKPLCPTPDTAAIIAAIVCAWRAFAAAEAERTFAIKSIPRVVGHSVSYVILSIVTAGVQDATRRNDPPTHRRAWRAPAIRPGPRALAATGGSLPAEFHPHVIARTVRQALLRANPGAVLDGAFSTEVHCDALVELVVADWCGPAASPVRVLSMPTGPAVVRAAALLCRPSVPRDAAAAAPPAWT